MGEAVNDYCQHVQYKRPASECEVCSKVPMEEATMFAAPKASDIEDTIAGIMERTERMLAQTAKYDPIASVSLAPAFHAALMKETLFLPMTNMPRHMFGITVHLCGLLEGTKVWGVVTFSSGRIQPLRNDGK